MVDELNISLFECIEDNEIKSGSYIQEQLLNSLPAKVKIWMTKSKQLSTP